MFPEEEIRLGLGALKGGGQDVFLPKLGSVLIVMQQVIGTFFFRFGWRGRGDQEEYWYREARLYCFSGDVFTCHGLQAIMRLLGLVIVFFDEDRFFFI